MEQKNSLNDSGVYGTTMDSDDEGDRYSLCKDTIEECSDRTAVEPQEATVGTDLSVSLAHLELDVPSHYRVEQVEFPESPSDLHKMDGFALPVEPANCEPVLSDDEEDKSIFQAQLMSNCTDVKLVRDKTARGPKERKRKVITVAHELLLSAKQLEGDVDSLVDTMDSNVSTLSPLPDGDLSDNSTSEVDFPSSTSESHKLTATPPVHTTLTSGDKGDSEGGGWGDSGPQEAAVSHSADVMLRDKPGTAARQQRVISVAHELLLNTSQLDTETDYSANPGRMSPDMEDIPDLELYGDSDDQDSMLGRKAPQVEPIPELTAEEEAMESRSWKECVVGTTQHRIDLKVLEPYKRVLSHGGYMAHTGSTDSTDNTDNTAHTGYTCSTSHNAIIVFSGCFLPDRSRRDYDYVMKNLSLYLISTLDQLVTEDYVLLYLHGGTPHSCVPKLKWMSACYSMIDRKLRKNLKGLYIVHPTALIKTIVFVTKPFLSSKFAKKIFYVSSLSELFAKIPVERASIPDRVKAFEYEVTGDSRFMEE